ncbi:UNVERIFIED_CONTAM: hypothetical protein Sradi_5233000 [Sesamum radiatum]|uniref:Alpha 1,4-glycosyltransferase domain-containing protein n=1 Tax=Sesamum radiatum TaxID=300843 RepID=A0AAW2LKN2_SESRA
MEFFNPNSSDFSCKFRFFMTWISSAESFGDRELLAMNSLSKAHPSGSLIVASNSLDSRSGMQILRPFLEKGLKVTAISPDFNYLFKKTPAQGLSYRFGGIYLDTDIIILKSFSGLKNAIGAQTIDLDIGKRSKLNNAVMIFDEGHPLLYKFIQDFALTLDGNKWGHNGPYMVSRVVSRVAGRPGYNFTVLPPIAFLSGELEQD